MAPITAPKSLESQLQVDFTAEFQTMSLFLDHFSPQMGHFKEIQKTVL